MKNITTDLAEAVLDELSRQPGVGKALEALEEIDYGRISYLKTMLHEPIRQILENYGIPLADTD